VPVSTTAAAPPDANHCHRRGASWRASSSVATETIPDQPRRQRAPPEVLAQLAAGLPCEVHGREIRAEQQSQHPSHQWERRPPRRRRAARDRPCLHPDPARGDRAETRSQQQRRRAACRAEDASPRRLGERLGRAVSAKVERRATQDDADEDDHRRPSSNDNAVPATAPMAKMTAVTFAHVRARSRASSSRCRIQRHSAASIIAGMAMPTAAKIIWKAATVPSAGGRRSARTWRSPLASRARPAAGKSVACSSASGSTKCLR
jgi:hypothetical protein